MSICFANAQVFYPEGICFGSLFVREGKISEPFLNPEITIDCEGNLLAPGLIDLQVNGIAGIDFPLHLDHLPKASEHLYKYGVTSFLATIVSQPLNAYPDIIKGFKKQGSCLGLHLEGPHINPNQCGAHQKEYCIDPSLDFWKDLLSSSSVKMMTLAPELRHALDLIDLLSKHHIVAACGHTSASIEKLYEAKTHGASLITHLFNAMPFHHRSPGCIGAALGTAAFDYSLIVDQIHVHPAVVAMAYNANKEGLILVSDCNALLGSSSQKATLSGKTIERNMLAGSSSSLFDCVISLQEISGCSLTEALSAASEKPARLLGIKHQKGILKPGADADLILLSVGKNPRDLTLLATYLAGVLQNV